ncbi:MAG: hypothetical protein K8S23_16520 [Candidatus Cloacimonetes bacterium]|nr:hypothetical protein [Candidatus Cloacimonadota bacterium]
MKKYLLFILILSISILYGYDFKNDLAKLRKESEKFKPEIINRLNNLEFTKDQELLNFKKNILLSLCYTSFQEKDLHKSLKHLKLSYNFLQNMGQTNLDEASNFFREINEISLLLFDSYKLYNYFDFEDIIDIWFDIIDQKIKISTLLNHPMVALELNRELRDFNKRILKNKFKDKQKKWFDDLKKTCLDSTRTFVNEPKKNSAN